MSNKLSFSPLWIAATATTLSLLPSALGSSESTNTNNWVGQISTPAQTVSVGDVPDISWQVQYPLTLDDMINFEGKSLQSKRNIRAEVRVIGSGWGTKTKFYHVKGSLYTGTGWEEIFFGNNYDVDPSAVVYQKNVAEGTVIDAAGQGGMNWGADCTSWSDWYRTWDVTPNVVVLRDGDSAPQLDPAYEIQASVKDYLSPYISSETGLITLGPHDVIYLWDFNNYGSSGWDLQDLCVLVTFSELPQ
ncbi:hypothetical protein [Sulfuriroseicoccus oceanibius]|uniref:Uncharacterized protein n=1 Tax=Sulfuriroseicoccus oceanibius TaxID=2707525 RepID=A0A6B3L6M7_9BACT|nr:hypothetical protein [Sulfuriroseicoccus oceanibius]QQL45497.1 hypothetical protein G3M56_002595 [Sulfuriroseicoccus oceanibius]